MNLSSHQTKSFLLYAILFNGQHHDPSHSEKSIQDLYYTFGFCLCCDVRGEEVLARLYMMLICRCSFQDFWLAYQNHSLITLMDAKGLAKARQDIQHLETFLKIKPNDWCPTVWHLRLFTRCQCLPGPCVARDYGFFNVSQLKSTCSEAYLYTSPGDSRG
ncbi:hypothetical protein BKA82DRAFT_2664808 [Pisolithus tinctorius]|nr:hypothetical protein BKA82DRAFT_2664808 [Pisolithus tinctorius]